MDGSVIGASVASANKGMPPMSGRVWHVLSHELSLVAAHPHPSTHCVHEIFVVGNDFRNHIHVFENVARVRITLLWGWDEFERHMKE